MTSSHAQVNVIIYMRYLFFINTLPTLCYAEKNIFSYEKACGY